LGDAFAVRFADGIHFGERQHLTAVPLPLTWQAAGVGLLGVVVIGLVKKPRVPRCMRTLTTGQSWG
jgi:hypothetical protein